MQHIIHHRILSCRRCVCAMSYKDGCTFLRPVLCDGYYYILKIVRRIKQRVADAYVFEILFQRRNVFAKRFHFYPFDNVGWLDKDMGISVGFQFFQCFHRIQFFDTACFQAACDNAGSVGFAYFYVFKGFLCFLIDRVDSKRTGVVIRGTEMYH